MLPPQANSSSSPRAGTRASSSGRRKSSWKACPSKVMTPRPKSSRSPSQSTILPDTAATSGGAAASARTSAASQPRPGRVSLLRKATASPVAAPTRRLLPAQKPRLTGLASQRTAGPLPGSSGETGSSAAPGDSRDPGDPLATCKSAGPRDPAGSGDHANAGAPGDGATHPG